jgi:small conductance mechanosensitive channel
MMEEPEIWGVESMTQDSVVVRMVVKTFPDQSAPVAREMRRRIRLLFAREGVFMHSTPRTMIVAQGEATPPMSPVHGTPEPPADPPGSASSTADSSSKRHPEERELGH